jgi:pSer/pThr/pTyr-binding forkhead associated (FHA) protein
MSEGVLTVLKFCLLALLYLFLARVVWVVGLELRGTPAEVTPAPPEPQPRGSRRRTWRLAIVEPPEARGSAITVAGEVTIGRAGGCGIPLHGDTFVSQVHARVFERDGDLFVEDLGSTNGTFLGRNRVQAPTPVSPGSPVRIGRTVLELRR